MGAGTAAGGDGSCAQLEVGDLGLGLTGGALEHLPLSVAGTQLLPNLAHHLLRRVTALPLACTYLHQCLPEGLLHEYFCLDAF